MALSLAQTQTLGEIAQLLYLFLPGKPHPYANKEISFQGIASALGLAKFWTGGSKLPAINQLLTDTFQYQNDRFCPLIIEIVKKGTTYRQGKGSPITYEEINTLNDLIAQVGFKIPELHDSTFLNSLPRQSLKPEDAPNTVALPDKAVLELRGKLLKLTSLPSQERGFEFEDFLKELFKVFSLAPRDSFRLVGEQIDGSFQFQGETYLVEATWQNKKIGQDRLLIFDGKVRGKAKWSRGLFISYSGFSTEGLEAFSQGKATNIICMDGFDLNEILQAKLHLGSVIERKVRRAAETNEAYVSVRELFPDLN
jgi:hypothetical protein